MDRVVRVPLVEQELLTLSEHMSSSRRFLVGFVLLDLNFICIALQISVCSFVLFLLAIVMSVLLGFTDSEQPCGTFKLFLHFKSPPTTLNKKLLSFVFYVQTESDILYIGDTRLHPLLMTSSLNQSRLKKLADGSENKIFYPIFPLGLYILISPMLS